MFDFPVVAEIPLRGSGRPSTQKLTDTRLDVVTDPGSAVAEAYRRLHTAVLLEPLAADSPPSTTDTATGTGTPTATGSPTGTPMAMGTATDWQRNGNGNGNGHGNGNRGHWVRETGAGDVETNGHANPRQVILVVSPGGEPTRSPVVANLAAVFAEAGGQALVVSVGNLDWRPTVPTDRPAFPRNGMIEPDDIVPLSVPSQVDGVSRLCWTSSSRAEDRW